jgi:hypothetical protein
MSKLAGLFCIIATLSGCAGINPQTRDEFRQSKLDGVPFSMVDSYMSSRRFEDVVNTLKQKTSECFNVDVTMRRTQGGITTMNARDEYRTTVRIVSANRAELTTQFHMKGQIVLQQVPEGGFYNRAVDIERLAQNKTKLTYYGNSFESSKLAWNVMKQWSDGQATPCP